MRPYEGGVVGEVIIGRIETKVGIGNGRSRHVNGVNDLLKKTRGEVVVGLNVVNGENGMGGRKAKCTAYLTKRINRSHDKQSNHLTINKRSETNQRTIIECMIGNRLKNNYRMYDQKPIKE